MTGSTSSRVRRGSPQSAAEVEVPGELPHRATPERALLAFRDLGGAFSGVRITTYAQPVPSSQPRLRIWLQYRDCGMGREGIEPSTLGLRVRTDMMKVAMANRNFLQIGRL